MRILSSLLLFVLRGIGRAILSIINVTIGLLCIGGIVAALANYTMTQGSGTTFASVVISTVHYAAMVVCDATIGTTQCAAVDASGNQLVKDAAVLSALNTGNGSLATIATNTGAAIPAGTNPIGSITNTSFGVSGPVTAVGPTAVGSANANPPIVVGGTATGAAGQNVQGLSIVAPSVAPVTATKTAGL